MKLTPDNIIGIPGIIFVVLCWVLFVAATSWTLLELLLGKII